MDYSYVFLILLLPALTFVLLGLAGMKMSHKTAGLIGTCSLAIIQCCVTIRHLSISLCKEETRLRDFIRQLPCLMSLGLSFPNFLLLTSVSI